MPQAQSVDDFVRKFRNSILSTQTTDLHQTSCNDQAVGFIVSSWYQ